MNDFEFWNETNSCLKNKRATKYWVIIHVYYNCVLLILASNAPSSSGDLLIKKVNGEISLNYLNVSAKTETIKQKSSPNCPEQTSSQAKRVKLDPEVEAQNQPNSEPTTSNGDDEGKQEAAEVKQN